jgi:tight adherence protein B
VSGALGLALALAAGYGVFLIYTALAFGWRGVGIAPSATRTAARRDRRGEWLAQAGLSDVRLSEIAAVSVVLFIIGSGLAYALFGGVAAPLAAGAFAASFPLAAARQRRAQRRAAAREAWPRMIEELRLLATSVGRSVPQALFDVGRRGPEEMRPAFAAAQREWLISTDFERTLAVLKGRLADATADSVCETLLIAHEMGGSDIDRRLTALVEDRIQDLQGRKDAAAKQAGARFARAFVVIVPLGMALVGLSIGDGRAAYSTRLGQLAVVTGMLLIGICWVWAGRLMRLPEEDRVFYESTQPSPSTAGRRRAAAPTARRMS